MWSLEPESTEITTCTSFCTLNDRMGTMMYPCQEWCIHAKNANTFNKLLCQQRIQCTKNKVSAHCITIVAWIYSVCNCLFTYYFIQFISATHGFRYTRCNLNLMTLVLHILSEPLQQKKYTPLHLMEHPVNNQGIHHVTINWDIPGAVYSSVSAH